MFSSAGYRPTQPLVVDAVGAQLVKLQPYPPSFIAQIDVYIRDA
jgi:hypothetical protein